MNCKTHARSITEQLRNNRLKATKARLQLLDIFEHAKKPMSVAEIALKLPSSDRATLYRNIESFEKLGLLKKIRFDDREFYYELSAQNHHHHIICKQCGKISDMTGCKISFSKQSLLKTAGFSEISDHSLEFFGVCNKCSGLSTKS